MAITTLPYPNMDFVPLDVLTADELDQIVANIEAINNASIGTSAIANNAITTAKVADGAITNDKIAGGTTLDTIANGALVEVVGTTTGNDANYALKFSDGRLMCFIRHKFTGNINSTWGNLYTLNRAFPATNYAVAFISEPIVQAMTKATTGQASCWIYADNSVSITATTQTPAYAAIRATSSTNATGIIEVVAYGFWK